MASSPPAASDGVRALLARLDRAAGETALLTVRHALTTANAERRTGSPDDELSPHGVEQARTAGRLLAAIDVEAVCVSPFRRARRTAELLLDGRPLDVAVDPLCAERRYGLLEGLTDAEVQARFPEVRHHTIHGLTFSVDPPGGESLDELHDRASRLLASLLERDRGRTVLVVSHGNFLQQLHARLRGLGPIAALEQPFEEIWNCSLNAFRVGPDGRALEHEHVQLAPLNDEFPLY